MIGEVLVIDDEPDEAALIVDLLQRKNYVATALTDPERALPLISSRDFDAVLADVNMQAISGLDLCQRVREQVPDLPVIMVTGQADVETAVGALRAGAWDFVTKPLSVDALCASVSRAVSHHQLRRELLRLRKELDAAKPAPGIVGNSDAIRTATTMAARIADSDATVLIVGETGTGKELVANAIHQMSGRRNQPFVAINCGAVPATLLESELFGYVKGAFTDARRDRPGLFLQAGEGTLFLDEVGEMPLEMQVKLLRALQQRSVRPVGGDHEFPIAARIVCATNRDLESEVEEGRFREDLYYRVNVVTIEVPPLRQRSGDVLILAQHFLNKICNRLQRPELGIAVEAARRLVDYDWPGNVRELENCLERAVALARGSEIALDDLPSKIREFKAKHISLGNNPSELITLGEMERRYVRQVLSACGGNKTKAAHVLGIDRRSLYRRLEDNGS